MISAPRSSRILGGKGGGGVHGRPPAAWRAAAWTGARLHGPARGCVQVGLRRHSTRLWVGGGRQQLVLVWAWANGMQQRSGAHLGTPGIAMLLPRGRCCTPATTRWPSPGGIQLKRATAFAFLRGFALTSVGKRTKFRLLVDGALRRFWSVPLLHTVPYYCCRADSTHLLCRGFVRASVPLPAPPVVTCSSCQEGNLGLAGLLAGPPQPVRNMCYRLNHTALACITRCACAGLARWVAPFTLGLAPASGLGGALDKARTPILLFKFSYSCRRRTA